MTFALFMGYTKRVSSYSITALPAVGILSFCATLNFTRPSDV